MIYIGHQLRIIQEYSACSGKTAFLHIKKCSKFTLTIVKKKWKMFKKLNAASTVSPQAECLAAKTMHAFCLALLLRRLLSTFK